MLLPGDRLLIRALVTIDNGSGPGGGGGGGGGTTSQLHEVTLTIGRAPTPLASRAASTLLRLEHHLVASNVTGYPLRLLQPEAAHVQAAAAPAGPTDPRVWAGGAGGIIAWLVCNLGMCVARGVACGRDALL